MRTIVHPRYNSKLELISQIHFRGAHAPRVLRLAPSPNVWKSLVFSLTLRVGWTRRGAASGTRGRVRSPRASNQLRLFNLTRRCNPRRAVGGLGIFEYPAFKVAD